MPEEKWEDGEGGWVYQLTPDREAPTGARLSVLYEKGAFGLPNGMAWNLVRLWACAAPPSLRQSEAVELGPLSTSFELG